jgi:hypothetical protein
VHLVRGVPQAQSAGRDALGEPHQEGDPRGVHERDLPEVDHDDVLGLGPVQDDAGAERREFPLEAGVHLAAQGDRRAPRDGVDEEGAHRVAGVGAVRT